jgi:hypothetical protein
MPSLISGWQCRHQGAALVPGWVKDAPAGQKPRPPFSGVAGRGALTAGRMAPELACPGRHRPRGLGGQDGSPLAWMDMPGPHGDDRSPWGPFFTPGGAAGRPRQGELPPQGEAPWGGPATARGAAETGRQTAV